MATEYLIHKWRLWFKFMDTKHSGKISKEDEEQSEEAYVKLAHLEGERKQEVLETSHKLWDQFVFHGKAGPITEDEFIEMTNNEYKADKGKFEEKLRQGLSEEFKVLDQTGEGLLNEDSFVKAFKASGIKNETWIKMFFQAFNPAGGKITLDSYANAVVQFLLSEDSTKQDIFMEALESYPGDIE